MITDAIAAGWPEDRAESIAAAAVTLHCAAVLVHPDVIVLEREPMRTAFPVRAEQFVTERHAGTAAGSARATGAMEAAGIVRVA